MIKCSECNQIFDEKLKECPNCGCPSEHAQIIESIDKNDCVTTDTCYKHERQIQYYANFMYGLSISIGVLILLLFIILGTMVGGGMGFIIGLILGGIVFGLMWVFALISKAYLIIYANISVNLHEINMKIDF